MKHALATNRRGLEERREALSLKLVLCSTCCGPQTQAHQGLPACKQDSLYALQPAGRLNPPTTQSCLVAQADTEARRQSPSAKARWSTSPETCAARPHQSVQDAVQRAQPEVRPQVHAKLHRVVLNPQRERIPGRQPLLKIRYDSVLVHDDTLPKKIARRQPDRRRGAYRMQFALTG